jgi:hypothetical protein
MFVFPSQQAAGMHHPGKRTGRKRPAAEPKQKDAIFRFVFTHQVGVESRDSLENPRAERQLSPVREVPAETRSSLGQIRRADARLVADVLLATGSVEKLAQAPHVARRPSVVVARPVAADDDVLGWSAHAHTPDRIRRVPAQFRRWNRDDSGMSALDDQIGNHPVLFAFLDRLEARGQQLGAAKSAADQHGDHRVVRQLAGGRRWRTNREATGPAQTRFSVFFL